MCECLPFEMDSHILSFLQLHCMWHCASYHPVVLLLFPPSILSASSTFSSLLLSTFHLPFSTSSSVASELFSSPGSSKSSKGGGRNLTVYVLKHQIKMLK